MANLIPPAVVQVIGTIETLINKLAQAKALLGALADSETTPKVGLTVKDLPTRIGEARVEIMSALRQVAIPVGIENVGELAGKVVAAEAALTEAAKANPVKIPVDITDESNFAETFAESVAKELYSSTVSSALGGLVSGHGMASGIEQAAAVAQLDSWTLPIPLPTLRTIGTLDGALYDALLEAVGTVPTEALGVGFAESSDPASPTPDSES